MEICIPGVTQYDTNYSYEYPDISSKRLKKYVYGSDFWYSIVHFMIELCEEYVCKNKFMPKNVDKETCHISFYKVNHSLNTHWSMKKIRKYHVVLSVYKLW